jgi:SAM-dependent methyltransferase
MESRVAQDLEKWRELYASGARPDRPPSRWVVDTIAALPNDLPLADIAGGTGRHAVPAVRRGHRVVLVDFVEQAVARAMVHDPGISGAVAEVSRLPLRTQAFGVVVVANFLDRSLFPDLQALLAPGGRLVYETYTLPHLDLVKRGVAHGPSSNEFLLRPSELRELASPLEVIEYWEGEVEDEAGRRCCARLVARSSFGERG